jgi:hypothetical protein
VHPKPDEVAMNRARVLAEELDEIEAGRRGELPLRSRIQADRQSSSEEGSAIRFCNAADRKRAAECQLCGLAFSGGGIRSATFNLGVIQALADLGLLSEADYLSTVSGGGYIGAWLTAWVHRTAGIAEVQSKLRKSVQRPEAADGPEAVVPNGSSTQGADRELQPITFLREHSNYLTPRIGLFSADTWSAISIYLRNLVLNLTILIGVLLAVLLLPRLALSAFEVLSQVSMTTYELALACLSVAVVMSGLNLRFVRKSESDDARANRQHRKTPARTGWKAWLPQQSAVLLLIVLPATTGAFFVAASMRRAEGLTWVELLVLAAAYLALWLLLVLVWKPFKVSTQRARDRRGSSICGDMSDGAKPGVIPSAAPESRGLLPSCPCVASR